MTITYLTGMLDVGNGQLPIVALGGGVSLHRYFRYPGGDWNVAPPNRRNGRADPPANQQTAYGLLYLADSPVTAAFEFGILRYAKNPVTGDEQFEVTDGAPDPVTGILLPSIQAVAHTTSQSIGFVDLEHPSLKVKFGIDLKLPAARISHWRELTLEVHKTLIAMTSLTVVPLVGLTFETQQAGGNGRIFAIFERSLGMSMIRGTAAPFDRSILTDLL